MFIGNATSSLGISVSVTTSFYLALFTALSRSLDCSTINFRCTSKAATSLTLHAYAKCSTTHNVHKRAGGVPVKIAQCRVRAAQAI